MLNSAVRTSHCDSRLLDFMTWSVLRGVRLFQRVRVTPKGLIATDTIPQFDFVAVVPVSATLSALNVVQDTSFPLRVSPQNFGQDLAWWPDLTWGSFAFVGLLTQSWVTGNVKGMQSYLDILPFETMMPIGKMADTAQKTKEYRDAVRPLVELCRSTDENFDLAFKHTYCLFRRHGIPLWSSISGGHPSLAKNDLLSQKKGDLIGLVPTIDFALHSSTPNSSVGFPDEEMLQWLAQDKGIKKDNEYIVLQALKEIRQGEPITMDRNQFFGFDKETFNAWFGYPYEIPTTKV
eukprot:GILI01032695.1.p1 GENE.GILI01032695.1~~GILI01032695.1.p1  ORF type:complete len:305 (+),score=37.02 GILI01032695.1:43-915(+)